MTQQWSKAAGGPRPCMPVRPSVPGWRDASPACRRARALARRTRRECRHRTPSTRPSAYRARTPPWTSTAGDSIRAGFNSYIMIWCTLNVSERNYMYICTWCIITKYIMSLLFAVVWLWQCWWELIAQCAIVLSADWSADSILQTPMINKSTAPFNDITKWIMNKSWTNIHMYLWNKSVLHLKNSCTLSGGSRIWP